MNPFMKPAHQRRVAQLARNAEAAEAARTVPTDPASSLVAEVFAALERHGYPLADARSAGVAGILLADVIDGYTGRIDSQRRPRTDRGATGGGQ